MLPFTIHIQCPGIPISDNSDESWNQNSKKNWTSIISMRNIFILLYLMYTHKIDLLGILEQLRSKNDHVYMNFHLIYINLYYKN